MIETNALDLFGYIDYHKEYIYPELQSKVVESKTVEQIVKPDDGYYGLSSVKIKPYEEGYKLRIENSALIFEKGASVEGSELDLWL